MTANDKRHLTHRLRLELQAKIGPIFDTVYSVIVILIGFYIFLPHLPSPVGLMLTLILLLSGLTLRGAGKSLVTRTAIVKLLQTLVKLLDTN